MGQDFEFLTTNRFIAYPFAESIDAARLHEAVVDAVIFHNRDPGQQIRLDTLDLDTDELVLTLADGTPFVTFSSLDKKPAEDFGDYRLHEWQRSSTKTGGFTDQDIVARLVFHAETEDGLVFPIEPAADQGVFESSVIHQEPERVRRIHVVSAGGATLMITEGELLIQAGFNMEVIPEGETTSEGFEAAVGQVPEIRVPTALRWTAQPGLGRGAFPTCVEETPPIFTINNQRPDDFGGFLLEATDCYWWERVLNAPRTPVIDEIIDAISTVKENALAIRSRCEECCSCDDFINAYKQLRSVFEKAQAASEIINDVLRTYLETLAQFKDVKILRETGLECRLDVSGYPGYQVGLQLLFFNNSCTPILGPAKIEIEAVSEVLSEFVADSGRLNSDTLQDEHLTPDGAHPVYSIEVPGNLNAARFSIYRMALVFPRDIVEEQISPTASPAPDCVRDDQSISFNVTIEMGGQVKECLETVQIKKPLTLAE